MWLGPVFDAFSTPRRPCGRTNVTSWDKFLEVEVEVLTLRRRVLGWMTAVDDRGSDLGMPEFG